MCETRDCTTCGNTRTSVAEEDIQAQLRAEDGNDVMNTKPQSPMMSLYASSNNDATMMIQPMSANLSCSVLCEPFKLVIRDVQS